jgi:HD-GYP domain-containing protein (c-di-GMP phosphodiesterase class II)
MVLEAVLHHHEWYDGRGYPHHLKGEDIPILARVIAIADSFDAMTTAHLPYRPPLALETAGEEVLLCAGTQFDPVLVEVFSDIFDRITEAYTEIRLQTQASPAPVSVPRVVITGEPVPVRRAYQPDEFEQAM